MKKRKRRRSDEVSSCECVFVALDLSADKDLTCVASYQIILIFSHFNVKIMNFFLATSPSAHHIYDSKQAHKPIPSTHIPAGHSLYLQGKALVSKAIPWSQDDVVEFLKRIGHEDLVPCFVDNVSMRFDISVTIRVFEGNKVSQEKRFA